MYKRSPTLVSLALAVALILSACGSATTPLTEPTQAQMPGTQSTPAAAIENLRGTLTVSGAFALYPMMTVWADEFTKLHADVQFDVQGGGAGKGMTDTLAGAVDIGILEAQNRTGLAGRAGGHRR
jgi:phosphate transport system substrate-binding protein